MATIYDRFMRSAEEACLRAWRKDLLRGARGEVLELGAGTGANLAFYDHAEVSRLALAEPDAHMQKRLRRTIAEHSSHAPHRAIELSEAPSERLPYADASFDCVVSTLVMCTVVDQRKALAEAFRVLRPGGTLLYLEHIAARDNPSRLAWQKRAEPVWKVLAGNCHTARRTDLAIPEAGFVVERETYESMRKALPIYRPTIRGSARKP